MSHITRLEEASSSQEIDLRSISLAEKVRYAAHTRDVQDVLAVKRSYHAMELLCGTSINHYRVQDARLGTIGKFPLALLPGYTLFFYAFAD